jgi:predicted ArsR family transcriptional regulator
VGAALGISKTAAFRHLSAMRACGVAEQTGTGRGAGWRLAAAQQADARPQYTTIEDLAQAVRDGLVEADDEQRAVLEQALEIAGRPRLTLLQGGGQ